MVLLIKKNIPGIDKTMLSIKKNIILFNLVNCKILKNNIREKNNIILS